MRDCEHKMEESPQLGVSSDAETDEEDMLVEMATVSLSLQKFLPSVRFKQSCPAQEQLSELFIRYMQRGHNTRRTLQGEPFLHFAIKNGLSLEAVGSLLNTGLSPNDLDIDGFSAFNVALLSRLKNFPVSEDCVLLLLDNGADVTLENDDVGNPIYHVLSSAVDSSATPVVEALLERMVLFNYTAEDRSDILHIALHKALSADAHLDVINTLIRHGAPVKHTSYIHKTPLYRAVVKSRPEVVATLLAHGAELENHSSGVTPLFQAVRQACTASMWYFTLRDVQKLPELTVLDLLIAEGAKVNVRPETLTSACPHDVTGAGVCASSDTVSALLVFFENHRDTQGPTTQNLRSFSAVHKPINFEFLLLMMDTLIDAGVIPRKGEIPSFITEHLFIYYADSRQKGHVGAEYVSKLWEKLEAAGFDLFVEVQPFRYRLAMADRSSDWIMPATEAEILERFKVNHMNAKPLKTLVVVRIRTLVVLSEEAKSLKEKLKTLPLPSPLVKQLGLEHLGSVVPPLGTNDYL